MRTEAQKKARRNYQKKLPSLTIRFYPNDMDLVDKIKERVEAGEGKEPYIKRLIREDINRQP